MDKNIVKRFRTKERAEMYVDALNEGINLINGACYEFAMVAKRFDGKVYNKRFRDAVNNALIERFGYNVYEREGEKTWSAAKVRMSEGDLGVYDTVLRLYLDKRDVQIDKGIATYFDGELYVYIRLGESCFTEGRRIVASKFEIAARATADQNNRTYARYRDAVMRWDAHVAKIAEIEAYLRAQLRDVNQMFLDIDAQLPTGERMRWLAKDYGRD